MVGCASLAKRHSGSSRYANHVTQGKKLICITSRMCIKVVDMCHSSTKHEEKKDVNKHLVGTFHRPAKDKHVVEYAPLLRKGCNSSFQNEQGDEKRSNKKSGEN